MVYSIEKIYKLVGKDDCVANLTFKKGSEAFNKYGDMLTVQFVYTQSEREELDKRIQNDDSSTHGRVIAKDLLSQLSEADYKDLLENGIESQDIVDIFFLHNIHKNTFHNTEKKTLNKHIIEFEPKPKGGDLGWEYGFYKKLVEDEVGLCPRERNFYLAGKLLFEPNELSEQEKQEVYFDEKIVNEKTGFEYLKMKEELEILNEKEEQILTKLKKKDFHFRLNKLDEYLKQAGSSFVKLNKENQEQALKLSHKVLFQFNERRLNVLGKYPIYIDIDSFLHIYMRHVEEFKVNQNFEHKDNFQWNEEDVFLVMGNIIREIEGVYQKFKEENPDSRYSKYGKQSIYFQGDYYTFHIDKTGRISTFHKNKKEHEKTKN